MDLHKITRVGRETRRRRLSVTRVETLGGTMRRIWFTGEDLADFESAAPEDHVKLFFADRSSERASIGGNYAPHLFDTAARVLAIDSALHGTGWRHGDAGAYTEFGE